MFKFILRLENCVGAGAGQISLRAGRLGQGLKKSAELGDWIFGLSAILCPPKICSGQAENNN